MTATAAVVALLDPSRTTTLVLMLGTNGLVVLSGVLVFHKGRVEDRAELAEEKRKLNDGLMTDPRTVHFTDPYQARIVRHSRRALAYKAKQDPRPPYVPREVDATLRAALKNKDRPTLLVVGMPRVGKGRSTFEAAVAELPNHWLVVPRTQDGLEWFQDLRPPCPDDAPVLLWLDELELFIRPGGLGPRLLEAWASATPEVKVVGVVRAAQLDELRRPGEIHQPLRDTLARFLQAHRWEPLTVSGDHTPDEWGEISRRYGGEEVKASLGDHLVSADVHLDRFRESEEACPPGFLVVWACALAQDLLREREISEHLLRRLFAVMRRLRRSTRDLPLDRFAEGAEFATAEFSSQDPRDMFTGLLSRRDSAVTWYSAPHYLVEYVRDHLLEAEWRTAGVPDDVWQTILVEADDLGVLMMGLIAYDEGRLDRAEIAWSRAMESRSPRAQANAAINLAELRRDEAAQASSDAEARERLGLAHRLLVRAWLLGDPDHGPRAVRILGQVLTEFGTRQRDRSAADDFLKQARECFEVARSTSHPDEAVRATWLQGVLAERLGDRRRAWQLLRQAAESGHYDVAPRASLDLGRLLLSAGGPRSYSPSKTDIRAATDALQRAADCTISDIAARAAFVLGEWLRDPNPKAAIRLYERALELDESALPPEDRLHLGLLLVGRQPERAGRLIQLALPQVFGTEDLKAARGAAARLVRKLTPYQDAIDRLMQEARAMKSRTRANAVQEGIREEVGRVAAERKAVAEQERARARGPQGYQPPAQRSRPSRGPGRGSSPGRPG
jgi:tetratricopeptide (TPR) repeat protein